MISFNIFLNIYSAITTFSKVFKKADRAVRALALFATIEDLAEAWQLKIKYAYALTLSEILNTNGSETHQFLYYPPGH